MRSLSLAYRLGFSLSTLLLTVACGGGDSSGDGTEGAGGATAGQGGAAGKSGGSGQAGVSGSSGHATGGSAGMSAGGSAGSTAGGASGAATGGASGKGGAAGAATTGGTAGVSAGGAGAGGSAGKSGAGAGGASGAGAAGAESGGSDSGAAGAESGGAAGSSGGCQSGVPCDGTCVDTQTDLLNCGTCGKVCDSTNGTATCVSGACTITCAAGFADCDGKADNGCEATGSCACTPGQSSPCYTGPAGTQDVGACKAGTHTCNAAGTDFGECTGQVLPTDETCLTSVDDDCDGKVNEEGAGCACVPGSTTPCYGGPDGTENVGPCKGGTQTCKADGTGYGTCDGQVLPVPESCLTPLVDDNCNGQLNESGQGCVCVPGTKIPCYEGAPETNGIGVCHGGQRTCQNDGTGYGTCDGQVLPGAEVCDGSLNDENCDGVVNEGGAGCACVPGDAAACYTGPSGTQDVGLCKGGFQFCLPEGTGYDACAGDVTPQAEVCDGSLNDENCNGQVNENGVGCVCVPGSKSSCYDGPGGTQGVGICKAGTHACNDAGTGYGACVGEVLPQSKDFCDNATDDDCNGTALACTGNQACNPQTGDCVDACDPALLGTSYIGCVYYPTVTPNTLLNAVFDFAVAVSNTNSQPATVTITRGGAAVSTVTVAANSVQVVLLPWVNELKNLAGKSLQLAGGAYKLVSTRPVTVYQYNPLEYAKNGTNSYTNDASLLLPVNAWTGNYRVIARHQWQGYSGFASIVASQNGTVVTLAAGPQGGQVKTGVAALSGNGSGTVTLNAGDVLMVVGNGGTGISDPNDLTGMLVTANKPVEVFGGHECIDIPDNITACDHIEESMFPLETLAKEYIVASPWIAANVVKAQLVRVLATKPNTTLTYDPPQAGAPTTIAQAGGWVELPQSASTFKITSSEPVQVVQYALGQNADGNNAGDPDMAQAVATAQYRTNYLFHAPTNYSSNFVTITAPAGTSVQLDGVAVPAASFTAIGGSGYSVARVQLSNAGTGNHTVLGSQPVGISVYGYGQYTSYWYPGGLDLKPIQN